MAVKSGRLGWVGIALEATPGVLVNPVSYIPWISNDLMLKQSILPDVSARGIRDQQADNSQIGKMWGEGTLKINLDPTLAGYFLQMAMGSVVDTNEGNGVYTHTFSRNNSNTPKTGSIIFNRVTDQIVFPYSVVNTLELAYSDGLAELTTSILSQAPITSVSGTLATTSGTLFAFNDAQVQLGANITAAVASSTFLKLRSFNIKINNTAEAQFVSGIGNADTVIVKDFAVSGSFKLAFENTTQRDAFAALTKQAMVVTFTGNGIGGGMNEFVKLRIYKLRFEDYKPNVPPDNIIDEEISFTAEYSNNDSATMDIQARNNKASY